METAGKLLKLFFVSLIGAHFLTVVVSGALFLYFKYMQGHTPATVQESIYIVLGLTVALGIYVVAQMKWILKSEVGSALDAWIDGFVSLLPMGVLLIVCVLWNVDQIKVSLFQLIPVGFVFVGVIVDMLNVAMKLFANRLAPTLTQQK